MRFYLVNRDASRMYLWRLVESRWQPTPSITATRAPTDGVTPTASYAPSLRPTWRADALFAPSPLAADIASVNPPKELVDSKTALKIYVPITVALGTLIFVIIVFRAVKSRTKARMRAADAEQRRRFAKDNPLDKMWSALGVDPAAHRGASGKVVAGGPSAPTADANPHGSIQSLQEGLSSLQAAAQDAFASALTTLNAAMHIGGGGGQPGAPGAHAPTAPPGAKGSTAAGAGAGGAGAWFASVFGGGPSSPTSPGSGSGGSSHMPVAADYWEDAVSPRAGSPRQPGTGRTGYGSGWPGAPLASESGTGADVRDDSSVSSFAPHVGNNKLLAQLRQNAAARGGAPGSVAGGNGRPTPFTAGGGSGGGGSVVSGVTNPLHAATGGPVEGGRRFVQQIAAGQFQRGGARAGAPKAAVLAVGRDGVPIPVKVVASTLEGDMDSEDERPHEMRGTVVAAQDDGVRLKSIRTGGRVLYWADPRDAKKINGDEARAAVAAAHAGSKKPRRLDDDEENDGEGSDDDEEDEEDDEAGGDKDEDGSDDDDDDDVSEEGGDLDGVGPARTAPGDDDDDALETDRLPPVERQRIAQIGGQSSSRKGLASFADGYRSTKSMRMLPGARGR